MAIENVLCFTLLERTCTKVFPLGSTEDDETLYVEGLEREVQGWDTGGRPDLLPENEDDGQDI